MKLVSEVENRDEFYFTLLSAFLNLKKMQKVKIFLQQIYRKKSDAGRSRKFLLGPEHMSNGIFESERFCHVSLLVVINSKGDVVES